jgi:Leucine-rich repeat (LRR) protein
MLDCSRTPLTSLPKLPVELESLRCSDTQITSLPELPVGLKALSCSNTQITEFPELPVGLKELYCWNIPPITDVYSLLDRLSGEKKVEQLSTLILKRKDDETIQDYNLRWRVWRDAS